MRKSAEQRKSEIVDSVMVLADQIGPDRVTTGAVAAAIGLTQAALFRHFPTKAQLWHAVAVNISMRLYAVWTDALEGIEGPSERLVALIRAQLDVIAKTPALPMLLYSRELNVNNAELRTSFQELLLAFQSLIRDEVTQAQQAGIYRKDVPPADITVLITSLVQGVAIRWSLGARQFPLQEEGERLLRVYLKFLVIPKG